MRRHHWYAATDDVARSAVLSPSLKKQTLPVVSNIKAMSHPEHLPGRWPSEVEVNQQNALFKLMF